MRDVSGSGSVITSKLNLINDKITSYTTTWSSQKILKTIQIGAIDLVISLTQETTDQTYTLVNGQSCDFTDSGGDASDYKTNENYSVVFDAGESGSLSVFFNSFSFEHNTLTAHDRLMIRTSDNGVDFDDVSVHWMQSLRTDKPGRFTGDNWESTTSNNGWVIPKDIARAVSLGFDPTLATVFIRRYISFTFISGTFNVMPGWSIRITAIAD
jgi:hypothetical protein